MAAKSNSVDGTQPSDIIKPTPFQMMLRAMSNDATADEGNSDGADLNAILEANTLEEMWDADERAPLNFQHLAGCELDVIDIMVKYSRAARSDIKSVFTIRDERNNARNMYLLVTCARISSAGEKKVISLPPVGEVFQANTSARYVVAKLWRALTMGLIDPQTGATLPCMVQEIDLGGGEAVLKLRPLPARTVLA